MKWFKHDCDANRGKKLKKVLMKFGAEGYGLYWYCIELIAEPIDKNNLNFELEHDAEILAHDLKMDSLKVEEIMRYMIQLGLFEASGDTIFCFTLARRIELSLVRSPQLKEIQRLLANRPASDLIPTGSDLFGKIPNASEGLGKAPDSAGGASKKSCLDVDVDLDKYLTTTTSDSPTPISKAFFPDSDTAQAILDQGVPEEFIDDYLPRFIAYWHERGTELHAWSSLFIEQCVGRYEVEGRH